MRKSLSAQGLLGCAMSSRVDAAGGAAVESVPYDQRQLGDSRRPQPHGAGRRLYMALLWACAMLAVLPHVTASSLRQSGPTTASESQHGIGGMGKRMDGFLLHDGTTATAAMLDEDPSETVLHIRHDPHADGNGSSIRRIYSGAFSSVEKQRIVVVIIDGHSIVDIEAGAFDRIGRGDVTTLSLSNNKLTIVPHGLFAKLGKSLVHLDLDGNRLHNGLQGAFHGLDKVETLSLARNPMLTDLVPGDLAGMPKLRSVDIQDCPLETLSAYVLGPAQKVYFAPELQTVRFSKSLQLAECMVDAAGFAVCMHCGVPGYRIQETSVSVHCIFKGGNTSTSSGADRPARTLGAVATLDAAPSDHLVLVASYAQAGEAVIGVHDGRHRHRSRRAISVLPPPITAITTASFSGLETQDITILIIEGQNIQSIDPGAFANIGTGVIVDVVLYNNGITSLPTGAFLGLDQLRGLDLGSNPLVSLSSGVFVGLGALKHLSLVNVNPLTDLPSGLFSNLFVVSSISLTNTDITSIARDVMGTRPASYGVAFDDSSIMADCTYTSGDVSCGACISSTLNLGQTATNNFCTPQTVTTTTATSTVVTTTVTTTATRVCSTLGWAFKYGNTETCGRSQVDNSCHRENASFVVASALCESVNGRLCTVSELVADVARGTGCSLDNRTVWTSESCAAGAFVFRMHGSSATPFTPECVPSDDGRLESVRCCASATDVII
eukprot:m.178223 g.178223  ORF g.178223 m.178223 type:complete len:721 (-) comp14508_c0_seq1:88-2250(-)